MCELYLIGDKQVPKEWEDILIWEKGQGIPLFGYVSTDDDTDELRWFVIVEGEALQTKDVYAWSRYPQPDLELILDMQKDKDS